MIERAKIGVPEGGPYLVEGPDVTMPRTLRVARAKLPTRYGAFEVFVYETPEQKKEQVGLLLPTAAGLDVTDVVPA